MTEFIELGPYLLQTKDIKYVMRSDDGTKVTVYLNIEIEKREGVGKANFLTYSFSSKDKHDAYYKKIKDKLVPDDEEDRAREEEKAYRYPNKVPK